MAHHASSRVLLAASLILLLVVVILLHFYGIDKPPRSRIQSSKTTKNSWNIAMGMKPQHPLDPLTPAEFLTVQALLRNASLLGEKERRVLHSVELEDPDKQELLRWKPGKRIPTRRAEVVMTIDRVPRKIVIDVTAGKIVDDVEIPGAGYPGLTVVDWTKAFAVAAAHPPFLVTLAARGLRLADVLCIPLSPGWYGIPAEEHKRLVNLQCFVAKDTPNFYMRPVEGVAIVVDLGEMSVFSYRDAATKAPVPKSEGTDYRFSAQSPPFFTPLKPISMEQPQGPSFTISGHEVKWANWEFHVRPHWRVGNVISQAKVDGRSVLYQGFLSELFVPYQTPEEDWYWRTYLDAGEYGLGMLAHPLQPLNDCPRHAKYLDAVFAAPDGSPYITPNMMCIFERYAGDVAWQHAETFASDVEIHEARAKVTLVVRMITSIGNYDYIIDWEFQTDGVVRVKVGATGIVMVKATPMESVTPNATKDEIDTMYGTLISENTIGVIHDHFLSFHMDLDVDGPNNSFVEGKFVRYDEPAEVSPRSSYWRVEKHVARTEEDARIQLSLDHPSEFYVVNPSKRTRLGNQVSYRVVPGSPISSLLDPRRSPQTRAAFVNNQIWVTRYNRTEKYAAGFFPYQSHGDDGLAVWSNRNRNIEDTDITLWYTMGFHHVPCQEDFPIMPTQTASFEIKPTNFFERNPILKIKPNR